MKTILKLNRLNELKKPNKLKELTATFFFYLSILFFVIGFNFSDNRAGGWYQQFMPTPSGGQVRDITFLDSLTGFAVTDSSILKTTNGGDNWNVTFNGYYIFKRIQFINTNTGFAGGFNSFKTTNGGINWFSINIPVPAEDMYVLNIDTMWIVYSESLTGGVFRTTNGGANWEQQAAFGNNNPSHIYMYNARIGFIDAGSLRKTTDGGVSWTPIIGAGNFLDMYFIDSLTGWKCNLDMKKTTDGGLNWISEIIPSGGTILGQGATGFMNNNNNNNNDTIWALGESIITGGSPPTRGILFRTINGGSNWLFQLPDTSIHINRYPHGQFINNKVGWAYSLSPTGIHTTTGGNDTFFTSIKQISSKTPDGFYLGQNYPNPFNPSTTIKFQILRLADLKLIVYDVTGKEITRLTDKEYIAGSYEISFDGSNYSSGIYFYSLFADGKLVDTKKMLMIK